MVGRRKKKTKYSLTPLGWLVVCIFLSALVFGLYGLFFGFSKNDTVSSSENSSSAAPQDTTPPVIEGAKDITVYLEETVSYRKGVTATDDTDGTIPVSIDSSAVDTTKEGVYDVIYSATDKAGNTASVTIVVKVEKKPVTSSEVTSSEEPLNKEDVYALADKKLKDLLKDGMTVEEQAKAIYNWANSNIWYSGTSDKTDYLKEAKKVLKGGGTDCFGYFAVCKLMFERLNIPNIDVVKVKNSETDSSHYWSLVSIDGGQSYYHFDATPRKGDGDYFFLVTDKALDDYSDAHDKSHNRDKSLYPATPEE